MRADVVVIGAGPAGLAAACRIAEDETGSVIVVDEGPRPGGRVRAQLYRHAGRWNIGAHRAAELTARAEAAGVTILSGRQVWSLDPGYTVALDTGEVLAASFIVVATGAAEKPLALPGWTTPGCVAVGAAQTLLNTHRIVPAERMAVIGVNALSLSIVDEMNQAGAPVAGVYLPPPTAADARISEPRRVLHSLAHLGSVAPNRLMGLAAGLLAWAPLARAAAVLWPRRGLRLAGIPLHLRECVVGIEGSDAVSAILVRSVSVTGTPRGRTRRIPVDGVCLSGGLYPLQELTAGCQLAEVPEVGGLVPLHSPDMETTQPNLFVAGNVTGIESAGVSQAQGELAGAAISHRLASTNDPGSLDQARDLVEAARRKAPLSFMPGIRQGRQRIADLWEQHSAARAEVGP